MTETDDGAKSPWDWTKAEAADICQALQANPQLRAEVLKKVDNGNRARLAEERADVASRDVERLAAELAAERARVEELERERESVRYAYCDALLGKATNGANGKWYAAMINDVLNYHAQQPSRPEAECSCTAQIYTSRSHAASCPLGEPEEAEQASPPPFEASACACALDGRLRQP
jgi:hypothetical protein